MTNKQKYIGNAKMKEQPSKPLNFKLKPIRWDQLSADLQNIIASREEGGVALSNEFGDSEVLGITQKKLTEEILPMKSLNVFGDSTTHSICQKTLTDAFVKVWQKLEDMTGEVLQGFDMQITPEYYIGETGADIHITANTVETNGIFEEIKFYANGTLFAQATNVDKFPEEGEYYTHHIDETTIIKCEAKIMGVWYERQNIITHYNSFWLGAGTAYTDIMDVEHCIPITNGMRGAYDVDVAAGDHLYIVVGGSLAQGFIRADMNSIEIPFTESTVEIEGEAYKVYTSVNTYNAGTYNIDING